MNEYWENRYKAGGNSGAGSYGEYAEYKAKIINDYITKYGIKTISDFGCGDGNQIGLFKGFEEYMGFDISSYALYLCHEKFKGNAKMNFCSLMSDLPEADLCISLDVIYRVVDENDFNTYLTTLFNKAKRFVLIFSTNYDDKIAGGSTHICHRKFTDWMTKNNIDFTLVEELGNFLPTSANFYLFERKS